MRFCKKCGKLVIPQPGQIRVKCACGEVISIEQAEITEKIKQTKKIAVTDSKGQDMPIAKEVCPKCGNGLAYWWSMQTRGADEAETQFFKCTKCSHTWREY